MNEFLSCDWGTSSFRLRHVRLRDNKVMSQTNNGDGIAAIYNQWLASKEPEQERINFYKKVLQKNIDTLTPSTNSIPVIISGMASSSIGIKELDYKEVPFNLITDHLKTEIIPANEWFAQKILLVSGVKTNDDIMRGEETMLTGIGLNNEEALVIFPGTHSKHVYVKNNVITGFKTYMSGEFFDLLANKSVLAKSVIKNASDEYTSHLEQGIKDGATGNLLNKSFHIRTHELLKKYSPEANYHYLSGLITGYELKDIATSSQNIHLVCDKKFEQLYLFAIKMLKDNEPVIVHNADEALVYAHCKFAALL